MHQGILLDFTLQHWCVWQQDFDSALSYSDGAVLPSNNGQADVSFLPPMQSRRLSPLAKAANAVAWYCLQQCGVMPAVFYSTHGESHYYFAMLQDMAAGEVVSPSRFSLCVHNAIAGLSSFYNHSTLPYICLAGGTDGVFAAFVEAAGLLLETERVLLVCYEQALPEAYQPYLASSKNTWAWAVVLSKAGGTGRQLRLKRSVEVTATVTEDAAQQFMQTLIGHGNQAVCRQQHAVWQWNLDHA